MLCVKLIVKHIICVKSSTFWSTRNVHGKLMLFQATLWQNRFMLGKDLSVPSLQCVIRFILTMTDLVKWDVLYSWKHNYLFGWIVFLMLHLMVFLSVSRFCRWMGWLEHGDVHRHCCRDDLRCRCYHHCHRRMSQAQITRYVLMLNVHISWRLAGQTPHLLTRKQQFVLGKLFIVNQWKLILFCFRR